VIDNGQVRTTSFTTKLPQTGGASSQPTSEIPTSARWTTFQASGHTYTAYEPNGSDTAVLNGKTISIGGPPAVLDGQTISLSPSQVALCL